MKEEEKEKYMHPTRIFKEEDEMYNAFSEYKKSLKKQSSEWKKVQYVGKEGARVSDNQKVPMTYDGFKRFCRGKYGSVHQYFDNKDGLYNDFVEVCLRIKEEIKEDLMIGGLLGFYNSSLTQRITGMADKSELTLKGNLTTTHMTVEEAKRRAKELDEEF